MNAPDSKAYTVYALALENERFYVGSARNIVRRFEEHERGEGAEWTRDNKPIKVLKEISCVSFAHALLTEDAVTLWLMGIHGRFPVKGGRWMRPDHETIYGLDETRWVQKASDLSDDEKADLVLQIVRWTIPDNWYWNHYLAKYPKMTKSTYLKDLGKAPEWVISERKKRNKMA